MGNATLDKGAWIGGRITKPSLDSIGDWLGGTLSKFVAGDNEAPSPSPEENTFGTTTGQYTSAFSHYSAISSANPSVGPSPNSSVLNVAAINSTRQFGSMSPEAMRTGPPHYSIDRAASAMDHYRAPAQRSSPIPRVASANAADHGSVPSMSSFNSARYSNGFATTGAASINHPTSDANAIPEETTSSEPSWWSSTYGEN